MGEIETVITVNGITYTSGMGADYIRKNDIGSYYPILNSERTCVIGFWSSEFGSPSVGYAYDPILQAYVDRDDDPREDLDLDLD